MADMEIRKAASELRAIWSLRQRIPARGQHRGPSSKQTRPPPPHKSAFALNRDAFYAALSEPFIPDAADALSDAMNTPLAWPESVAAAVNLLPAGHAFNVPKSPSPKSPTMPAMKCRPNSQATAELKKRPIGPPFSCFKLSWGLALRPFPLIDERAQHRFHRVISYTRIRFLQLRNQPRFLSSTTLHNRCPTPHPPAPRCKSA